MEGDFNRIPLASLVHFHTLQSVSKFSFSCHLKHLADFSIEDNAVCQISNLVTCSDGLIFPLSFITPHPHSFFHFQSCNLQLQTMLIQMTSFEAIYQISRRILTFFLHVQQPITLIFHLKLKLPKFIVTLSTFMIIQSSDVSYPRSNFSHKLLYNQHTF